ncbi:MAG: hypothetical protein HQ541_14855 [Mariniphaga sp.]|nr:hypothetical protein [Mariniphaga sp.]
MENNKIDVVYVLGNGSKWDNNEIRFSLRSIEKNLLYFRNVYIVGSLPTFLTNVIHVPAKDIFDPNVNTDGNIITKVLEACKQEGLSKKFLFINDDHLVLKPIEARKIPPYHKGNMVEFPDRYWKLNYWRKRLQLTKEILLEKKHTTFHFDCHTPVVFDKKVFPIIFKRFNYKENIGYTMKSIYGNVVFRTGKLLSGQKKTIFRNYSLKQINIRLKDSLLMSFNDQGLNSALKYWLIRNFPDKSKYEKDIPSELIFDIYNWNLSGENYQDGVGIFAKYFKHKNLIKMFRENENDFLRVKLNYKLNQILKQL